MSATKFERLSIDLVNNMLTRMYNLKASRDCRGLIDEDKLHKAIAGCFGQYVEIDNMHGYINALVAMGYLRTRNVNNKFQFFLNYDQLLTDENGKTIGVRWYPLSFLRKLKSIEG